MTQQGIFDAFLSSKMILRSELDEKKSFPVRLKSQEQTSIPKTNKVSMKLQEDFFAKVHINNIFAINPIDEI